MPGGRLVRQGGTRPTLESAFLAKIGGTRLRAATPHLARSNPGETMRQAEKVEAGHSRAATTARGPRAFATERPEKRPLWQGPRHPAPPRRDRCAKRELETLREEVRNSSRLPTPALSVPEILTASVPIILTGCRRRPPRLSLRMSAAPSGAGGGDARNDEAPRYPGTARGGSTPGGCSQDCGVLPAIGAADSVRAASGGTRGHSGTEPAARGAAETHHGSGAGPSGRVASMGPRHVVPRKRGARGRYRSRAGSFNGAAAGGAAETRSA